MLSSVNTFSSIRASLSSNTVDTTAGLCALTRTVMAFCAAAAVTLSISHSAQASVGTQGPMLTGHVDRTSTSKRKRVRLRGIVLNGDGLPVRLLLHDIYGQSVEATLERGEESKRVSLPADELIGLHWFETQCDGVLCEKVQFRIVDAARDRRSNTMVEHSDNRDVWLYRVEFTTADKPDADNWQVLCTPDAEGQTSAVLVAGTWDRFGSWRDRKYTFACTSGAISKCIRTWGYKPWKELRTSTGDMVSLGEFHRACVRAARADYCGVGSANTVAGTPIDMFDRYGFNRRDSGVSFTREAGFNEHGAVWLQRMRLPVADLPAGSGLSCGLAPLSEQVGEQQALIEVRSRAH